MSSVQSTEITIGDVYRKMSDGKKFFVNGAVYCATTNSMPNFSVREGLKEFFDTFTEDEKKVAYYLTGEALKRKASFIEWIKELDKMEGETECQDTMK